MIPILRIEIANFPGYYVTNKGDVYTTWKQGRGKYKSVPYTKWQKLRPQKINKYGHVFVALYKEGVRNQKYIHQIVLETFVGPCPKGMECRHLDGNPSNNNILNVEWSTHYINMKDRVNHNTGSEGTKNGRSLLTEIKVKKIRSLYDTGKYTLTQLATLFKVDRTTIWAVKQRIAWSHI